MHPEPVRPPAEAPSTSNRVRDLLSTPFAVHNAALTGLFLLAAFYTLYFARSFFLPIALAFLLSLLLSPVVRALRKMWIPEPMGAALVLLAFFGMLGWAGYQLADPAAEWIAEAPKSLRKVELKIRELKKPVQSLGKATEQVEKLTHVAAGTTKEPPKVAVSTPSLGEQLIRNTRDFLTQAVIVVVLLFFLLATGDRVLRKFLRLFSSSGTAEDAETEGIARALEKDISTYLVTVTLINLGLGLATWGAMAWIGLPNPLLWGAMAAIVNYIPYLGAGVCYAVLTMVGLLTFPELGKALLAPALFGVLNLIEAYGITPLALGRQLTLDPVVVFLALTFWGWLWGIPGAILAVPLMVVLKIFCDRVAVLAPIGELLGT